MNIAKQIRIGAQRIFGLLFICIACIFGTMATTESAFAACGENQIDILGDGTQCETAKFTLTTTNLSANDVFKFSLSATGTFYVDCGTDGTLSGTGASDKTITRSDATLATYTCTYSSAGAKTIRFGGLATNYSTAYQDSNNNYYAAIAFSGINNDVNTEPLTPTKIASVSGNLSAIFPYISGNARNGAQPRFYRLFSDATNLTTVPDTLFADYTNGATKMFRSTFNRCTGLTSIPATLFSGITTGAERMFYATFYGCSKLSGYIPPSTFAGLIANGHPTATDMWTSTFYNTNLATTCPVGTTQYTTGYESEWNGKVSCEQAAAVAVTLDDTDANTAATPATIYLNYGDAWYSDANATTAITGLTTLPTKTDRVFGGYYTGQNGAGTMVIDENGDFVTTNPQLTVATLYPFFWEPKFTLTTTNLAANDEFKFNMSATGTFYVDCGADGVLSGTGADGDKITRTNTTEATYTCTYTTAGAKTLQFGGLATGYSTNVSTPTIRFYTGTIGYQYVVGYASNNNLPTSVAAISGSLGAIFPTLGNGDSNSKRPKFEGTFMNSQIQSIPENLFSGVSGPAYRGFYFAFAGCTGLTSIPENLFSGLSGASEDMFAYTFYKCTGLTSIPGNLFAGFRGAADAMFSDTFGDCTGLTYIPDNLFAGLSGAAGRMFAYTFAGCTGLTSIPDNLFAGLSGGATRMFEYTFSGCRGLTSIPENLFAGATTSVAGMFRYTFYSCRNLTGYIPATTFSGLISNNHPTATDMWTGTFSSTNVATTCPANTTQYITGYESEWNGKVSCTDVQTVTYSCGDATGTPPANSAVVTGSTFVPAQNTCSKPGYVFYGWGVSGTNDTVIKPFTWNYSGNKTLTAQWGLGKFNLTTTNLSDGDVFKFTMTAQGTFTVDCGTDGVLSSSANDITNGNTITRSNTTIATYTCTYSTGGVKTIAFDGSATNYSAATQDSNNNPYAAIAFSGINYDVTTEPLTPTKIASVSGNLSSIFPYISGNATNGAQPRFYSLFNGATNLTTVPDTLFADYTKGATQMFRGIFYNCTGLTSIPADLFSGITTGASSMFSNTFRGCSGLTSIPADLFSGITTGASYMFYGTFYGCTGLTSIPADLFSGITTGSQQMFQNTFQGCTGLTSIPADLFSGIKTGASNMFYQTFYNCTGLTSIPAGLFSGITKGADYMFNGAFNGCTGLQSIPAGLFSGITTGATQMFRYTFNRCTGLKSIPAGLFSGITTGASNMFYGTFYNCTGLTSIPADLFSGIKTGADNMFAYTFKGCTNLTGYIPPSTFAGLIVNGSPTATDMWVDTFTNTQVATSCPAGTVQYMTGYEGTGTTTWDGKVSCVPDSENTTSTVTYSCGDATGTAPANSAVVTGSTFVPAENSCSKPGYVFYGWGVSGTNDMVLKPFTWNYSGNKTLTAQWGLGKFNLTTTNLSDGDVFKFTMTAQGTFTVDCGADGTLTSSANDITNGNTITRNNVTQATYTCTYTTGGVKTIAFDGTATNYSTAYQDGNNNYYAAIAFTGTNSDVSTESLTPTKIASVSGNLSSIFPYISGNAVDGAQPRFVLTFSRATNLTTVPDTLFANYTKGATQMFRSSFNRCTGLTSIPAGLFSGIKTGADYMFQYTFIYCSSLTSIPAGLFSGITTGANGMFLSTFEGCTGLTSIPAGLFSGIKTGAAYMFYTTFLSCTGLTSIPAGLFSGITTGAENMFRATFQGCRGLTSIPENLFFQNATSVTGRAYMFYSTFQGCTGLTSIPAGLFSKITTSAQYMFAYTFFGCRGLTSIPATLFSGITTGASYMFYYTFSDCTGLTSIPADLFSGITTGASNMFHATFLSCSGLQSIPAGLFSGIKTGASEMFRATFVGCTGLTSIPSNLFSGITTGADYMFRYTFNGCTGLTSIPADLFSGITTGASNMFTQTFSSCSKLSGYIPPSTFAGLIAKGSPTANNMWLDTFTSTKLATSCPAGTVQYMTGYEGSTVGTTWNGRVSCVPDSENTTSTVTYSCGDATGTAPANQAAVSGETFVPAENSCSKPGYVFYGWGVSGTNDTVMKPFTWNYSGNKTLTAQWGLGKFNLTTTNLSDGDVFKFTMSAQGTFTVDCGADGVLSSDADDITDGNTITRNNVTQATYTCTYSTGGVKTIAFDGLATNYSTAYQDSNSNYYAAIAFTGTNDDVSTESLTPTKIAAVSGNLSSIFPYISGNAVDGAQPRFGWTFRGATNLTIVPDTLFADYTTGAPSMFRATFSGCTGLTSIPAGLFSGIKTAATRMFRFTFSGCTGLTSIPARLFGGITTGATEMFNSTFYGCTGLTSIPADLFSGITTGANSMFYSTFSGCTGLTSIPAGLFSNITTGADYMFYNTFSGCTGLQSIPADLFSGITTGAGSLFASTFNGCTGLTSIPAGLFSGITNITSNYGSIFNSTFRGCTGLKSIPAGLFSGMTGGASWAFPYTFKSCTGLTSIPADLFSNITNVGEGTFYQTFYGCTGLTSIPAGLFSGIKTGAQNLFAYTFQGCTGLTSIPAGLFSSITTGAEKMFYQTFVGCSKLSGYIPPSTFAGLIANGHPTATDMWLNTFYSTKLATSCPAGTVQYMTGYEGTGATTWNGKVSCVEYPNQLCSPGEYLPNTASVCQPCTENSYCTGGTFAVNTAGAQGIDMCPNDWYSPAGMSSVDQCGRILHIGDSVVYLRSAKKTTPSLNVDLDNDGVADFFGNMTTVDVPMTRGTESKLKLQYGGQTYSVYDDSVSIGE